MNWMACIRPLLLIGIATWSLSPARAPAAVPDAVAAPPASPQLEANRLIDGLERQRPLFLFDMHGNANEDLQRLMQLRFGATAATEAAIDRMQNASRQEELVNALYHVMGYVKDPAAIPWLEKKLASQQRERVYEHLLPLWQYGFSNSYGVGDWPWLTGQDRWIAFFIAAHARERSVERRRALLDILEGFDRPAAQQFFSDYRTSVRDPGERLLVETYLHDRGVAVDDARIAEAIKALQGDRDNRDLLLGTGYALRHAAYIPYLIRTFDVESQRTPDRYESRELLRRITLLDNLHTARDWRTWYAQHGDQTRAQWVAAASAELRARLARDPVAAKAWFEDRVYVWDDIAFLDVVRTELVLRPDFHDLIATWINLTYHTGNRSLLAPLAKAIAQSPTLSARSREMLGERGYLPREEERSWEREVGLDNYRL
ncbi:hypothetical protein [Noviluteimonas gilva]|uniref:DUF4034 domain-containing protein n=1 Tax=Noviluteimonas gilva TaxID=2682097 RepID=A0A7C9HM73_9GAMM|nr:hypothetical protein [Lysobacter gilvus]MUV14270.1 hypothetical protein [Lysobacter gilvus]